jgi:hypothetical protein
LDIDYHLYSYYALDINWEARAMTSIPAESAARPLLTPTSAWLLGAALAAIWVGANLLFPALAPTGVPSAVTRLAIHAAILAGLWLGLQRTGFSPGKSAAIWLAVAVPFTLWLAVVWSLALNGVFQPLPGVARLPRLPVAVFLPLIVALPLLLRSGSIAAVLDAMPLAWLVALQLYRVFGGIFLVNWAHGVAPGLFAWPAGTGDMLTGIMALPVALALASGSAGGRRAALLWNIFGITDLAVAVTLGFLSTPGPLQQFGFDIPVALVATYPTVLIPAFAVPSSILLHALSLRQLSRRRAGAVSATGKIA